MCGTKRYNYNNIKIRRSIYSAKFQILMSLSSLPDTILSSPRARQVTAPLCPTSVVMQRFSSRIHTCTVQVSFMLGEKERKETDFDCAIVTGTDKPKPIRRDSPHALDVPKERRDRLAGLDIPHTDSVVQAAGDEDRFRLDSLPLRFRLGLVGVPKVVVDGDARLGTLRGAVCVRVEALRRIERGVVEAGMVVRWRAWEGDRRGCEAWKTGGKSGPAVDVGPLVLAIPVFARHVLVNESDALDLADVTCESPDDRSACKIPENDCAVVGAGEEHLSLFDLRAA